MFTQNLQGKVPFISDDRIDEITSGQSNDKVIIFFNIFVK